MHQATLVDLFCKEHKDYDRRNKQDVQRIESKFRTTAYARQELIKKWKREKKEFLRKQELRTRSETDASHLTPHRSHLRASLSCSALCTGTVTHSYEVPRPAWPHPPGGDPPRPPR